MKVKTTFISNCIFFAFIAMFKKGGAVILVRSRYGKWFHALWLTPRGRTIEFIPVRPHTEVLGKWKGTKPKGFRGRLRVSRLSSVVKILGR